MRLPLKESRTSFAEVNVGSSESEGNGLSEEFAGQASQAARLCGLRVAGQV
jgi:hypothetical protein